ncbi:MAG: hypothetical protein FJX77_07635, partial [Armatimonadetes bacterium]|nr:hypothetical protein [Armatimonadota bacterium]
MSFGRRLFRLAQHHAAEALDWLEDTARARPDPAREELEEFLRRPADPEPRPRTEIPRTEARRPPDPDPP